MSRRSGLSFYFGPSLFRFAFAPGIRRTDSGSPRTGGFRCVCGFPFFTLLLFVSEMNRVKRFKVSRSVFSFDAFFLLTFSC